MCVPKTNTPLLNCSPLVVGKGGPVLRASLGCGILLASHAVVIAHHYLDAMHECPPRLWAEAPAHRASKVAGQQRRRREHKQRQGRAAGGGTEGADVELQELRLDAP